MIRISHVITASTLILLSACSTTPQTTQNATPAESQGAPESGAMALATGPKLPEARTGYRPAWYGGESPKFPRIDHITIRGKGATPEEAAQQARERTVELLEPIADGRDFSQYEDKIEIVDMWLNDAGDYYALAIFPRKLGESLLRQKITALDDTTRATMEEADVSANDLIRVGYLHKALALQQRRAVYQKSMKHVELTGHGIEPQWDTQAWSKEVNQLLKEMRIAPDTRTAMLDPTHMSRMLTNGLKTAGVTPVESKKADYLLKGDLKIAYEPQKNGWVRGQATLQVQVDNNKDETTYGTKEWTLEITALNEESARQRLVEKSEFLLKRNMRDVLVSIAGQ